jgi:hypothetical protein
MLLGADAAKKLFLTIVPIPQPGEHFQPFDGFGPR